MQCSSAALLSGLDSRVSLRPIDTQQRGHEAPRNIRIQPAITLEANNEGDRMSASSKLHLWGASQNGRNETARMRTECAEQPTRRAPAQAKQYQDHSSIPVLLPESTAT